MQAVVSMQAFQAARLVSQELDKREESSSPLHLGPDTITDVIEAVVQSVNLNPSPKRMEEKEVAFRGAGQETTKTSTRR